jgi:flagellin
MGLRINQNPAAMNAYRSLNVTDGQMSKSLEKLSSGFRINRAADDAAGLAISEKLRAQVTGLNTASANAQNAVSLLQTAEGALNETHSILQRMRELAVQSSNDTNVKADREKIQLEVDQLAKELNRIGNTTEFNTQKILSGGDTTASATSQGVAGAGKSLTFAIGANKDQTLSVEIEDMRGGALGVAFTTQAVLAADGTETTAQGTVRSYSEVPDATYGVTSRPRPRRTAPSRRSTPPSRRCPSSARSSVPRRTDSSTPSTTSVWPRRTCPPPSRGSATPTWPRR